MRGDETARPPISVASRRSCPISHETEPAQKSSQIWEASPLPGHLGAPGVVVGEELFDPVHERGAEDRRGVSRHRASRVRGEHSSYHAEDARDRAHAEERPERTSRGLGGGRERGNLIPLLPRGREYSSAWASFSR